LATPGNNERKAELIKYWHQRAVLDRVNIQIKKVAERCQKGQNFVVLLLLLLPLRHTLFPRDFSGTIADRDIVGPTDVPFGGHKTELIRLGQILAAKSIFACCRAILKMKIRITV